MQSPLEKALKALAVYVRRGYEAQEAWDVRGADAFLQAMTEREAAFHNFRCFEDQARHHTETRTDLPCGPVLGPACGPCADNGSPVALARSDAVCAAAAPAVLLAVAASIRIRNVQNCEGAICGSAWGASQRQTVHGGDHSPEQVRIAQDDCQLAGDDALARIP